MQVCEEELKENPNRIESYVVMCWSLVKNKQYAEAEQRATEGLAISPYDLSLIEILGEAKFYLGKNAGAMEQFQKYVGSASESGARVGSAYYFMGEIYIRQARFQHADIALSAIVGIAGVFLIDNPKKFENAEKKVRYFWVKPSDVAIYVERGAADIGVAGKDILLEYAPDVYELLDLDMGKCRMCVAGKKEFVDDGTSTLRVATKFTNIAKTYYAEKCRDIDIIKLNGSIEIAPILSLSDVIVDIVETGATLKENGLEPKETIVDMGAYALNRKVQSVILNVDTIDTDFLDESSIHILFFGEKVKRFEFIG